MKLILHSEQETRDKVSILSENETIPREVLDSFVGCVLERMKSHLTKQLTREDIIATIEQLLDITIANFKNNPGLAFAIKRKRNISPTYSRSDEGAVIDLRYHPTDRIKDQVCLRLTRNSAVLAS